MTTHEKHRARAAFLRTASSTVALGLLAGLGGCAATGSEADAMAGADAEPDVPSLQAKLDARKQAFTEQAPADLSETYEDGIRQVGESSVMETALQVGDRAPDFQLPTADGGTLRLSDALADGPVVLTWYRGGWCPYCTDQLKAYGDAIGDFRARGATVIGIGPEVQTAAAATAEDNAVPFPVVSDQGNRTAAAFGVGYRLPTNVIERFTGRLDIPAYNGDTSWTLPLSVTYVIDQDRTIRWAYINPDYRQRAETADLLTALDDLNRS